MKKHYSKATGGFYDEAIHGANIPDDAVEISNETHAFLMAEQGAGKRIVGDDNGFPVVQEPPAPTADQLRKIAKRGRAELVDAIQVTTQAGHTFDGDETSQSRMARAIVALAAAGPSATVNWVLADNTVIDATAVELTEALALAGAAQAAIWVI